MKNKLKNNISDANQEKFEEAYDYFKNAFIVVCCLPILIPISILGMSLEFPDVVYVIFLGIVLFAAYNFNRASKELFYLIDYGNRKVKNMYLKKSVIIRNIVDVIYILISGLTLLNLTYDFIRLFGKAGTINFLAFLIMTFFMAAIFIFLGMLFVSCTMDVYKLKRLYSY